MLLISSNKKKLTSNKTHSKFSFFGKLTSQKAIRKYANLSDRSVMGVRG